MRPNSGIRVAQSLSHWELRSKWPFLAVAFCLAGMLVLPLSSCGKEKEKVAEKEVIRPVKMVTVTSSSDTVISCDIRRTKIQGLSGE